MAGLEQSGPVLALVAKMHLARKHYFLLTATSFLAVKGRPFGLKIGVYWLTMLIIASLLMSGCG